ncbi:MAG: ABC transporter ATP-binding protein [Clostridia bacterium]|nr:ABC transporter ATP-binding protein [Clostridia bacterium]
MSDNEKKKGKAPIKTLARTLGFVIKSYPVHCVIVLICIVVTALVTARGTMFSKELISDYIQPMLDGTLSLDKGFRDLGIKMIFIILTYGAGVLSTFLMNRLMVYVTQGTLKIVRDTLFEHMEKLPLSYFDKNERGDIMSIYTNDTDTLRQLISQSVPNMISNVSTVVTVLISMIILSPLLTLTALIVVTCAVIITRALASRSAKYFRGRQKNIGEVNAFIEETVEGQRVVKVFTHEEKILEAFDEKNERLYDSTRLANGLANVVMPIMGNLGYLNYVIVAVVGGFLAINKVGGFQIAALIPFLQFTRQFNMPISQFSQQLNSIIMALAGAERIFGLLDEPIEEDQGYVTLVNAKEDENGNLTECEERTGIWAWKHPHSADGSVTYTRLRGDIVFEGVDFGYTPEKTVLHDINLYAHPGEKIAFVGATGAGKTTITNLINRFYDIQNGKIRYDGINIQKIKKADLRRSLGVVLQDTHLFSGTVADNIRYGKLDATDEEVHAAAKLAGADYFISHLPKGYDTEISGDGANLSQGQRQLIAIARAAVADPPVLILDEATSSIDTRTEAIVQRGMDSLMEGRTVFVIAHRLSTVKNSSVIMVLANGRIIERGSHDSLLEDKGVYYTLYTGNKAKETNQ